jgi:hypothetical protein
VELSERPVSIRRFEVLDRREVEVDGVGCVDPRVVIESHRALTFERWLGISAPLSGSVIT